MTSNTKTTLPGPTENTRPLEKARQGLVQSSAQWVVTSLSLLPLRTIATVSRLASGRRQGVLNAPSPLPLTRSFQRQDRTKEHIYSSENQNPEGSTPNYLPILSAPILSAPILPIVALSMAALSIAILSVLSM